LVRRKPYTARPPWQPPTLADRIVLMGWSQGGAIALLGINDKSSGRPAALAQDFVAAVAFYPSACSERLQSKPFTQVEPQQWTTAIPLLVLFGEADSWTLFAPCEAFISAAKARGNPVELKSYPSAVRLRVMITACTGLSSIVRTSSVLRTGCRGGERPDSRPREPEMTNNLAKTVI
jgi:hypothetical protein